MCRARLGTASEAQKFMQYDEGNGWEPIATDDGKWGTNMTDRTPPKKSLMERAADAMDLPPDVIAGLPRLEITGCRRILMENHKGILEYGDQEIDINGGQVVVRIKGRDLELRAMNVSELSLEGLIFSIEFLF